jgi:hypothetical protein
MPHKANKNYNPNGERRAEGGRQTALLPQKTRKIYSYNQVKKALSEGLRNPAAVPVNRFQFFAKKDGKLESPSRCVCWFRPTDYKVLP